MKESEIIIGNDEICQMLGWESNQLYVYRVPNLFPSEQDSGWTKFNTQDIAFHSDWNLLIGAYNYALKLVRGFTNLQKELLQDDKAFFARFGVKHMFGISDVNHQVNINASWLKLVDFCKWYNSIKLLIHKP
jgi:hypothetical protein